MVGSLTARVAAGRHAVSCLVFPSYHTLICNRRSAAAKGLRPASPPRSVNKLLVTAVLLVGASPHSEGGTAPPQTAEPVPGLRAPVSRCSPTILRGSVTPERGKRTIFPWMVAWVLPPAQGGTVMCRTTPQARRWYRILLFDSSWIYPSSSLLRKPIRWGRSSTCWIYECILWHGSAVG